MQNRLLSLLLLTIAAGMTTSLASVAATPTAPSVKPKLIAASDVISSRDAALLRDGLQAVDRSDW
ncbi:MAG: hypothetical protein AAFY82_10000, partial [Pseudomonadota bacterium]